MSVMSRAVGSGASVAAGKQVRYRPAVRLFLYSSSLSS